MRERNNGKKLPQAAEFTLDNVRLPDHEKLRLIVREGSPEC
jgi:hypothetical protein